MEMKYVHIYITCIHTYIRTYTHIHTYMHTYIHTCIHTYIHTHVHTYIHTHTHMHTYTHTHTHIHTYRGESVVEAENYMNLEMRKILEWAQNNRLKFNENKSKVMLMSRRRRTERKETEIYVNGNTLKQVTSIKYLCTRIIFDNKITFVIPPFSPQFPLHSMWLLLVSQIAVRQTWPCCRIKCRSASSF